MFGSSINDEFFDAIETGLLVNFDEMYAEKRDRHKEPYMRHLAGKKLRQRLPNLRQETSESMARLRRKVQRKKKEKEKVEP